MKNAKRVLSLLLSLTLVLGAVAVGGMSASADIGIKWEDGENYCEISDYAGLKEFASRVNGGETKVTADCESEITLGYKESKRFAFEPEFVPEGATAHIFYNGEDRGEGTSIEVKEPTDDYTVECKVLDKDGNEIATSGEIKVKVKNSFFDRLKWFFNNFWANILKTFIDALIAAC